jgi:hypothetical protein
MAEAGPDFDRIKLPGLLVCEGRDDKEFLGRMLGEMGIERGLIEIEQFAPRRADGALQGGESWIPLYIGGLPLRQGFDRLRALGIVQDADRGPKSKLKSVRALLKEAGLPVPRIHGELARSLPSGSERLTVGVFIMPDGQRQGTLEDLYFDAIDERSHQSRDRSLDCVDAFLDCLDPQRRFRVARRRKARLYGWFASREDPTVRPGQALSWNYVRAESQAFGPIRAFLAELAAAAQSPAE